MISCVGIGDLIFTIGNVTLVGNEQYVLNWSQPMSNELSQ